MHDLELMRLHVEALYLHDERQRLLGINQWSGGVAPRLFLGRTRSGHVLRFRADVDAELVAELTQIWEESLRGPDAAGVPERPACARTLAAALAKRQPVERSWAGPAYAAPPAHGSPASGVVMIRGENAHLLRGGLDAWLRDVPYLRPFVAALERERAVAVCASVRITDAAHEAGVETAAAARRSGHASRAVATWISAVHALGATPLYSTSWDNLASRGLAARLGLAQFGVDFHLT
jgi:hypothetical protein